MQGQDIACHCHRLNTIRNADQILVIADGRIVQSGTHGELMESGGLYRDFVTVRQQSQGWKPPSRIEKRLFLTENAVQRIHSVLFISRT